MADADFFLNDQDLEAGYLNETATKEDLRIRQGFIRKVYGLLCCQLMLTIVIAGFFTLNEGARIWAITSGNGLAIGCGVIGLALVLAMTCVPNLSRKHPTNLIMLSAFTVCQAIGLGILCATVAARSVSTVLQAFVITGGISLGLTLFAMQTKYDLTAANGIMLTALLCFTGFGLLRMFFPHTHILETIYGVAGAGIFSIYIIIDTQMLIGTKRLKVSEDDYVFVVLSLYMDILNLFVNILRLLSQNDDDN